MHVCNVCFFLSSRLISQSSFCLAIQIIIKEFKPEPLVIYCSLEQKLYNLSFLILLFVLGARRKIGNKMHDKELFNEKHGDFYLSSGVVQEVFNAFFFQRFRSLFINTKMTLKLSSWIQKWSFNLYVTLSLFKMAL